jgi:Beta-glucosidase (SUN family)
MLIPTSVESSATLAIPDTSYWCETAAHYYINPPGTSTDEACVWGTSANPWGNWAPYVAGGNTDANGNTFIKLGWNPIYLQAATPFNNVMPSWGVSIECDGGGCNGLPCAINPSVNGVNEMVGSSTNGAGGGAFCVVTVPEGVNANFVITGSGGSGSGPGSSPWSSSSANGGQFYQSASSESTTSSAASSSTWSSSTESSTATAEWSFPSILSSANATTHHTWLPSHSPYYSLFNASATAAPTAAGGSSEATLTASYSGPSTEATLPAKGEASTREVSITVAVLAALAALSF